MPCATSAVGRNGEPETKKPSAEAGLVVRHERTRTPLPSRNVGQRSARARGHARRHVGRGQDVGVGVMRVHEGANARMRPRGGCKSRRRGQRLGGRGYWANTGITDTRMRRRSPGSSGRRERYFAPRRCSRRRRRSAGGTRARPGPRGTSRPAGPSPAERVLDRADHARQPRIAAVADAASGRSAAPSGSRSGSGRPVSPAAPGPRRSGRSPAWMTVVCCANAGAAARASHRVGRQQERNDSSRGGASGRVHGSVIAAMPRRAESPLSPCRHRQGCRCTGVRSAG